jgi:hypothetical protein
MATVCWDRKGVLVAFMNPGATITSEVYCEMFKEGDSKQAIWHAVGFTVLIYYNAWLTKHQILRKITAVHFFQLLC